VRVRAGVDDDTAVSGSSRVQCRDNRPFGVVLFAANLDAKLFGAGGNGSVEFSERLRAVDFSFGFASLLVSSERNAAMSFARVSEGSITASM